MIEELLDALAASGTGKAKLDNIRALVAPKTPVTPEVVAEIAKVVSDGTLKKVAEWMASKRPADPNASRKKK